ncbi:Vesicle transport protein [Vigna angularis]|uniref:Vesicle transport protein n=1 Tax=Phaseolus angularis TaxID=3914 RepID=A0A8T0K3W3_PHAAN|nr:Vesicle transport protein [Vigna angularis]
MVLNKQHLASTCSSWQRAFRYGWMISVPVILLADQRRFNSHASLHKITSIFAVESQLPPPYPPPVTTSSRRLRARLTGQSWFRAFNVSGKTVGKGLAAEKGINSARMIEFLVCEIPLGCAEFDWTFMFLMDIWKEEVGVIVDFGEGNIAISDLELCLLVATGSFEEKLAVWAMCCVYALCWEHEIGLGLTGFGIFFSFLGVMFFFDKGLLAMGNILFVSGVSLTIGLKSTMQFFMKRSNFKGTISFGIGFIILILGWPILGMIVESYGFIVLFSGFWPTLAVFIQKIPVLVIGSIQRQTCARVARGTLEDYVAASKRIYDISGKVCALGVLLLVRGI